TVCIALIFVILKYDVIGYDTYVPSDSQIQSCAVSIHQLMPLSQRVRLDDFGSRYISPIEYRMANMEIQIQGNPNVMALARKAAKEQLECRIFDYYDGIEEMPEYIETLNKQENYQSIGFGYKLRNGRTIYRDYIIDLADADTLALLSEIFNDSDYKIGSTPVFNDHWKTTFEAVYCMNNFKGRAIQLTPDMQAKLIETYQKEYMGLTLDTVMHVMPVGTIDFMVTHNDRSHLNYSDEMEVYPQFTETIALLRTYGFDMEEKMTADDVESISVYGNVYNGKPSYYRGAPLEKAMAYDTSVEDSTIKYTDKEQIQQILDSVINDRFSWQLGDFADYFDDQYNIEVRFMVDDNTYSSYRFIKGQIPDFVKISEKNN
ncbi:MAG: hypothetical protein K2M91_03715, partial [Lachnospiraceae bacterium]|nr:hypothetical protein [Lachnospiraceae bacterium]